MKHTHRVDVAGGSFMISCTFARDIERILPTGLPRDVRGQRSPARSKDYLILVVDKIIAVERVGQSGTEAEDSCSYNR